MADEKKAFDNGVDKLWRQVDQLTGQAERKVIERVVAMRKDIVDRISGAPVVPGLGGVETIDPQFMAAYRDELQALLVQWARAAVADLNSALENSADLGVSGYGQLLTQLAGETVNPLMTGVLGLAPEVVQAASLFTAQQFTTLANQVQNVVADAVQRAVFGGQSRWDAVRQIREALKGQPGQKTGLGSLTSAAVRIERTSMMSVFNAAAQVAYVRAEKSVPGLMVEWSTAGQKTVCPRCQALNGKRKKIRALFPGSILAPPLHPQCRCRIISYHPDWE